MACQHPTVVSLVIESCQECEEIRAYDIRTLTKRVVRKHLKPFALCLGPGKSLLFVTVDGTILELEWINEVEGFAIVCNIQVTIKLLLMKAPGRQELLKLLARGAKGWASPREILTEILVNAHPVQQRLCQLIKDTE